MRFLVLVYFFLIGVGGMAQPTRTTITDKLRVKMDSELAAAICEGEADKPALTIGGALKKDILLATAGTYNLDGTHLLVIADATAGDVTINLLGATTHLGWTCEVRRKDSTSNKVRVVGTGLNVIIYGTNKIIVESDGSTWNY